MFAGLTLLLLAMTVTLSALDTPLKTDAAPLGIISFEFARTLEVSRAMLASWNAEAVHHAFLIQGLDFLYLLLYPAWFALAAQLLARGLTPKWKKPAQIIGGLVLLCAPLDAVENIGLILQLLGGPESSYAALAYYCAMPKFLFVIMAAVFVLIAGSARLLKR